MDKMLDANGREVYTIKGHQKELERVRKQKEEKKLMKVGIIKKSKINKLVERFKVFGNKVYAVQLGDYLIFQIEDSDYSKIFRNRIDIEDILHEELNVKELDYVGVNIIPIPKDSQIAEKVRIN